MAVNENGVPMLAYNVGPDPLYDLGAGDARTVARALVAPPARHEPPGSRWWFIGLIPIVGSIILLVFFLLPPDPAGARFDR